MTNSPEHSHGFDEADLDAEVARIMGGNATSKAMHEQIINAGEQNTLDTPDHSERSKHHVGSLSDEEIEAFFDNHK